MQERAFIFTSRQLSKVDDDKPDILITQTAGTSSGTNIRFIDVWENEPLQLDHAFEMSRFWT